MDPLLYIIRLNLMLQTLHFLNDIIGSEETAEPHAVIDSQDPPLPAEEGDIPDLSSAFLPSSDDQNQ